MNEIDVKKLFGQRIKELRLKRGLTQEQLAPLIDVGERNLSKIECGKCFVKAETIARLLNALEVEPKELFDFSVPKDDETLKEILITAIKDNKVNVNLLYRIYRSIEY